MTTAPTPSPTAAASAPLPAPVAPAFTALHLRLVLVALGLLCLALSLGAKWLRPDQADVFSLWAMIGLGLAALPVLFDSLTSLKSDGFEATKYYMDQFVALAILACFATGQYATGTIVAAILIVGQMLEEHTTLGVEEAVNSLLRLSRVKARRLTASGEELVDAAALRTGDRLRALPGDTIAADGVIASGLTTLDQASITGESLPVDAAPGSTVYAGTTNLTGAIEFTVSRTGPDTVIGRVTGIVEEAKTSRAPVMRLIDDYTRYYMPLVLIIAGFVLFFTHEVDRAIAVVIVAMPCAFVLASPSAMVAALAVASRMGVLVKSSRFFEAAQSIDTVVLDKTGTLTTGRLRVTALHPAPGLTAETLLALAASLEAHSTHPIARAVLAEAEQRLVSFDRSLRIEEVPGRGVRGGTLLAGRRTWLEEQGVAIPADFADVATSSTLYLAREGVFVGAILLADTLRAETAAAVAGLRRLGIEEFVMLTGDRAAVAEVIKTADVALMGSDLRHLPRWIALSDRTLRVINQNLLWGFAFIALFVALSAFGVISPIAAAFLHEFSAFFVIFNSARLLRFDEQSDSL
jgi:Cd2+/Zn2+-exporting ATPase